METAKGLEMKHGMQENRLLEGFAEDYFICGDGTRLRYFHSGEGHVPLIMVPAFDAPADCYSLNAPMLADEHPVYILEQRGHGYSDAPPHGRTVQRLAADLNEFIRFIGSPTVNLLGWSMGAAVLWAYVDLFGQERIEKLIFVDQPPVLAANPYAAPEERRLYGSTLMDIWHVHHVYWKDFYAGWPVLESYWDTPDLTLSDEELERIPGDYARKISLIPEPPIVDKEHREFLAELLRNHLWNDWRGVFPLIEKPVLLLTGDVSHATNEQCGRWMQETLRDCSWIRFSSEEFGGHSLLQTAYEKFNRTVLDFLNRGSDSFE